MTAAPLAMGKVTLTVHDLDRVAGFYESVVGLHRLSDDREQITLGTGDVVLLELRRDAAARRSLPREAGLFHTAFLLPSRADLGAWMRHAAGSRAPIVGASDHAVSEAIYLSDPEGNGVEIYADRPPADWRWKSGAVDMPSDPLDLDDLLDNTGDADWQGFPPDSVVGHVHLQVGAIPSAEAFYATVLGFDITCRYPGGTFYASNSYHHHLATNIWNSRGAALRDLPSTGLADVEILCDAARIQAVAGRLAPEQLAARTADRLPLRDPWGTSITLVAR